MWKTVLRRLLMMIPQIIILSVIAFFVAKIMPGDPFTGLIDPNIDPAIIEQKRIAAG
ncbi:ABC transporter permease, partial [Streptococcus suis]